MAIQPDMVGMVVADMRRALAFYFKCDSLAFKCDNPAEVDATYAALLASGLGTSQRNRGTPSGACATQSSWDRTKNRWICSQGCKSVALENRCLRCHALKGPVLAAKRREARASHLGGAFASM